MNKLALGTVQFGMHYGIANNSKKIFPQKSISEILKLAKLSKITTLDTAIAYGSSEKKLGKENLDSFDVITKISNIPSLKKNIHSWIRKEVELSLQRLNQNKIYGVLLHKASDLNGPDGKKIYEALSILKKERIISKIGISIYSPSELDNIVPNFDIDIVQSPFNVFDTRLKTSGWMNKLHQANVEIHTRSTFLQGLLLMDLKDIPTKFIKWTNLFALWDKTVDQSNMNKMEACIQFSSSFNEIDKVIFGVDNVEQFKEVSEYSFQSKYNNLCDMSSNDEYLINPTKWSLL
jgi:aryl-alcohol dehydrogenase-like predicted oxidoreductase